MRWRTVSVERFLLSVGPVRWAGMSRVASACIHPSSPHFISFLLLSHLRHLPACTRQQRCTFRRELLSPQSRIIPASDIRK